MRPRNAGSITKRNDLPAKSRFWAQVRVADENGKTKRMTLGFYPTRMSANQALEEYQRTKATARGQRAITIEQWSVLWLESLNLAETTIAGYRRVLRLHINPYLGGLPLTTLDATRLNRHYQDLEEAGLSLSTIQKVHQVISSLYSGALRDGSVAVVSNPAKSDRCRPPSNQEVARGKEEMIVWNARQLDEFIRYCTLHLPDPWSVAWRLLARTGMRRSELLGLRFSDHNPITRELRVRRTVQQTAQKGTKRALHLVPTTKSSKPRTIDLDLATSQMLVAYRNRLSQECLDYAADTAHMFINDRTLPFGIPNVITARFSRHIDTFIKDHPDIPRLTMHGLRHTHASHLLAAGVPVNAVANRLGHNSTSITLSTYAHLMPGAGQQVVAAYMNWLGD